MTRSVVLWIVVAVVVTEFLLVIPATLFVDAQSDGGDVKRCRPNSTDTPIQCVVRFNNTLILICPSPHSNWVKASNENGSSICETSECTVNPGDQDLTYSDSGLYFCKSVYSDNGHIKVHKFEVNVTVQTPPQLTIELVSCDGDSCTAPWVPYGLKIFNITVSYKGLGPFWVEWYLNDTAFNCEARCTNTTTNDSQTLLLDPSVTPEDWQGEFRAVVHNDIGGNSSHFETHFFCDSDPVLPPTGVEETQLRLTEGNSLNYSCSISAPQSLPVLVCFTPNKSQSFNKTKNKWEDYCVIVDNGRQLSNSNITVQRENTLCPPRTLVKFTKNQLSLNNSGLIFSAYVLNGIPHLFAKLNLSVDSSTHSVCTTNVLVCTISPSVGGGCILLVVVVLIVMIVAWHWKRKRRMSRDQDETAPLLDPHTPNHSPQINDPPPVPVIVFDPPPAPQRTDPVIVSRSPNRIEPDGSLHRGNTPNPPSSVDSFSSVGSVRNV